MKGVLIFCLGKEYCIPHAFVMAVLFLWFMGRLQKKRYIKNAAVLTQEEAKDSYVIRSTVYKYYFTHLKLWGQPYEEQGFQITPTYWIGHAHNIFLQYGTDFGIIVMILFGMFEYSWGVGSLTITMLFSAWRGNIINEQEE